MEEINEIKELNDEFIDFLRTKGIKAKFELAFSNIKKSAKIQHQKDVQSFNEVKEKSIEENKEFYEFLHTKGFKAKVKLIIENIKKDARESKNKPCTPDISVQSLNKELDIFLKSKNLENKYFIKIEKVE
ncbi:MAG: hypothetical protein ACI35S_05915 [Anaeroplasma sp.]